MIITQVHAAVHATNNRHQLQTTLQSRHLSLAAVNPSTIPTIPLRSILDSSPQIATAAPSSNFCTATFGCTIGALQIGHSCLQPNSHLLQQSWWKQCPQPTSWTPTSPRVMSSWQMTHNVSHEASDVVMLNSRSAVDNSSSAKIQNHLRLSISQSDNHSKHTFQHAGS